MDYVSQIFDPKPSGPDSWGLRGDPLLYDDMKEFFSKTPLPISENEFKSEFEQCFLLCTGHSLYEKDKNFITLEKYSRKNGGMSNGCVSLLAWRGKLLSRLLERLRKCNSELTK